MIRRDFLAGLTGSALATHELRAGEEPRRDAEAPKLVARLEVEARPDCFTVRFFLKNVGEAATEVVYGHGRGGKAVVPSFVLAEDTTLAWITPPIYAYPAFRHMKADKLALEPGREVLYDTYTMGYPPRNLAGRKRLTIQANIEFQDEVHPGSEIRAGSEPVPFPPIPSVPAK